MLKYKGGDKVKGGYFWCIAEWEIVPVEGRNGILPGGQECSYVRVPVLLFLPAVLLVSGVYVIFLPFIGIAILLGLVVRKTAGALWAMARTVQEKTAESLQSAAKAPNAPAEEIPQEEEAPDSWQADTTTTDTISEEMEEEVLDARER